MNKKYNPMEYVKNKKNDFTQEMLSDTIKYQKKYRFDIGENNKAHNNEADAFKHALMQAIGTYKFTLPVAKALGAYHESEGRKIGQPKDEENMDYWNNRVTNIINIIYSLYN